MKSTVFSFLSCLCLVLGASGASGAIIEDFESGWGGVGNVVVDPDNGANSALFLIGGEAINIAQAGPGVVTMDIFDFGAIKADAPTAPSEDYGPRWGVAGAGTSAGIAIIAKPWLHSRAGYGIGTETSQTSQWWSPGFYGAPRHVDSIAVIGAGSATTPDTAGDGDWTTWTFDVAASGDVTITNSNNANSGSLSGLGSLANIWISGGMSHATQGELATHGVLVDNVSFTSAIPEPTTLGLLALSGLALLSRRRRM